MEKGIVLHPAHVLFGQTATNLLCITPSYKRIVQMTTAPFALRRTSTHKGMELQDYNGFLVNYHCVQTFCSRVRKYSRSADLVFDGMLLLLTTVLWTQSAWHNCSSLRCSLLSGFFHSSSVFLEETDQICGKATTRMETGLRSAMRYIRRIEEDRILSS